MTSTGNPRLVKSASKHHHGTGGSGASSPTGSASPSGESHCPHHPTLNNLWSIWYCTMALGFQVYIIANSIQRVMRYVKLSWPDGRHPIELNAYVACVGAAVVLLPFFLVAAMMKIGNHPNDGHKLGSTEDAEMQHLVVARGRRACTRWIGSLWRHGGPTAPLLHMASAFCLLLPRVLIQAQLIKNGFISKADVWKTDLDFLFVHEDRLIVLSGILDTVNATEVLSRASDDDLLVEQGSTATKFQLEDGGPISAEFINYGWALLVYAVRYPSVFWRVNKCFGLVFSGQLILDGLQKLIAFAGFAVFYKVLVFGPREVLLRFSPFLLDTCTSVLLFVAYNVLLTVSGSVLYMYGLHKYREWEERRSQKHHITWREESRRLWGYLPHLVAFVVLLVTAACVAPLMYDFTMVYCGSLDGVVLVSVSGTMVHLLLWIVLWLLLTMKQRWSFAAAGYGLADGARMMCNGHMPPGDIELIGFSKTGGKEAPLLVIESGQTYHVREKASKKAILNLAQKSTSLSSPGMMPTPQKSSTDDDDIYWLKPKPPSAKEGTCGGKDKEAPDGSDRLSWLKSQRKSPGAKHKVTFDEGLMRSPVSSSPCKRTRSTSKSPKIASRFKTKQQQNAVKFDDLSDSNSDDGDYATLRDITVVREDETDDDHQAPTHKSLCPLQGDEADLGRPLLGCMPRDDGDYELLTEQDTSPTHNYVMTAPVVVHTEATAANPHHHDSGLILRSDGDAASQGNVTPRSGSISETSTSPEKGGSDTSSGVHSTNSSFAGDKRSASMENLPNAGGAGGGGSCPKPATWKSMSLQRNVMPPTTTDRSPRIVFVQSNHQPPRHDNTLYCDPHETTMVIRRKQKKTKEQEMSTAGDVFGRATNMRMTSFTDQPDFPNSTSNSAIQLPPQKPPANGLNHGHPALHATRVPPPPGSVGVSTFAPSTFDPNRARTLGYYHKPVIPVGTMQMTATLPAFRNQRRDSANYSLTSSGDSDNYIAQT